ncbi:MAG: hypothetical protein BWK80_00315 [Desulfobacteraceae bacterium IS3]|nr:MAG: hypothetical protein BWK80_00315 [Desulfobacteraceae bacterium IS3]
MNIANADNLKMCGLDIYVTYDKNVIEAAGIKRSPLSSEYGWDYRIQEPGIVRAVLATGTEGEPLRGDGVLFWLDFNVKGNEGDRTELKFQIDATSIYDCGDLKNEVPLDLNDTGIFTVNWKNILCDLNGDGKVDSSDIAFLLKLAVGNAELSEDLRHIGDSSGDGRIRSNDAAMCMRISTGNPLAPPSSGMKRNTPRSSSVTVNISDNIEVLAGGSIWVPVNISDMKDLAGADIVLNYDPTLLTVKNVRTSSLTENFDLDFNVQTGQAKISLSCKDGDGLSGGSGTLVEAEFTAKPNAGISSLTLASVRLNDSYGQDFEISALQTEIDSQNGELKVIVPSLMDAILCLKILTGMDISIDDTDADFIAKGKIELSDVIYILQWIAGIRFN